jgi:putative toxin-antitoxin system antitoxin component (TIGR02293 family)
MSAIAFNIRQPEAVAHELGEANARLARERAVPPSIVELIEDLAETISEADAATISTIDPSLWIQIQAAALRARNAVGVDDVPEQRRAIRIALEQVRFLFARLAERQPVAEDRPIKEVLAWLDDKLAVPQRRKADLLGVGERTYQRWVSPNETAAPEAEQERRARVVARVTSQLRHVLTGPGVADWFETPMEDLDDRKPLDVLGDPNATEQVLHLAVAPRSFTAA